MYENTHRTEKRERATVFRNLQEAFNLALLQPSHTTIDNVIDLFDKLQDTYSDRQLAEFMVRNTIFALVKVKIYPSDWSLSKLQIDSEEFEETISENELYPECERKISGVLTGNSTVGQIIELIASIMENTE